MIPEDLLARLRKLRAMNDEITAREKRCLNGCMRKIEHSPRYTSTCRTGGAARRALRAKEGLPRETGADTYCDGCRGYIEAFVEHVVVESEYTDTLREIGELLAPGEHPTTGSCGFMINTRKESAARERLGLNQ